MMSLETWRSIWMMEVNPDGFDFGLNGCFVNACVASVHMQTPQSRFVFRLLWSPKVAPSFKAVGNFYRGFMSAQQTTIHLIALLSAVRVFGTLCLDITQAFHTLMLLHFELYMSA